LHTCGYKNSRINNSAVETVQQNNNDTIRKRKIPEFTSAEK